MWTKAELKAELIARILAREKSTPKPLEHEDPERKTMAEINVRIRAQKFLQFYNTAKRRH